MRGEFTVGKQSHLRGEFTAGKHKSQQTTMDLVREASVIFCVCEGRKFVLLTHNDESKNQISTNRDVQRPMISNLEIVGVYFKDKTNYHFFKTIFPNLPAISGFMWVKLDDELDLSEALGKVLDDNEDKEMICSLINEFKIKLEACL